MRRLGAAFVIVIVALSLTACGGGDTAGTTDTNTAAADGSVPPPVAAPGAAGAGKDLLSPREPESNETFPQNKNETPADVLARLQDKQPMVLFFFDETQTVTRDQREEFDAVMQKYRGMIDLLSFDIKAGGPGSATEKDPEVVKAMNMATRLKVTFTPYIVFVDRYGRITYRFSGFTDAGTLEREVLRATQ
jgi:hypothetical protein